MLLLDEPFGALDALTRGTIQDELLRICSQTQQTVFMITHDVDEAILLADTVLLMSNGPQARIGEVVRNPLPRSRQRATLHHEPLFYAMRNHLVDFLVSRSKTLSHGRAPEHPPQVSPGVDAGTAITPTPLTPSDPSLRAVLQRVV
jgi:nitrate/nitrite transport system ATP-binding protein